MNNTAGEPRLADLATEYYVGVGNKAYFITRHDNHNEWVPDHRWVVAYWVEGGPWMDSTNVDYLGADGKFRYKSGTTFATAERACEALLASGGIVYDETIGA